ncbi:MAG: spore germination protein [Bacillota bacterium]|nr:spore germination protein [Bacillota bacterium]MDI7248446.1 spore germination protein [Bacillota bacterium]
MDREQRLARKLEDNLKVLEGELGVGVSFDILARRLNIAGRDAALLGVDGLVNDAVLTNILRTMLRLKREDLTPDAMRSLFQEGIPHIEVNAVTTHGAVIDQVLSGPVVLLVDGLDTAFAIDVRTYPARSPQEPQLERVLRGSRDGFVETLVFNTALIRRRIRDPRLRVERFQVGRRSKTDVVLVYLQDVANPKLVAQVRDQLKEIQVDAIPMAEKSVEEYLQSRPAQWWNPFPLVRYTERPDVAAVHLFEGHLVILVDTSPSAMILPVTFFHHIQHAEEYREDVSVGTYLRLIRFLGIMLAWVGPPLWVALVLSKDLLPPAWQFLGPKKPGTVPLPLQFFIGEMVLDLVRLALIHTPEPVSTALGFIGTVLLGQIAAEVGLLASETVLYVALAALGGFATPSMEFAMAVRLMRLLLLAATAFFRIWGVAVLFFLQFVFLGFTRSFGVPYLWPLIPPDWGAFKAVTLRLPTPARHVRPSILKPKEKKTSRRRG